MAKTTAETAPYTKKPTHAYEGSGCSYTPSAPINPLSYGRSGSSPAALGNVPETVVGGSSQVGTLPTLNGTLKIGDNKNVSTPVSEDESKGN